MLLAHRLPRVTRRLPDRAASASTVLASAFGSGRFRLLVPAVATKIPPGFRRPWQRIYRGQERQSDNQGWINDDRDRRQGYAASQAPFLSSVMQIEPQWIDYNGHLNMALYNVMFDRAVDPDVAGTRHRPRLHEGTPRLDLHSRVPCSVLARDPPRRPRADFGLSAGGRRKAPAPVPGRRTPPRRLAVRHDPKTCPSIST